MLTESYCIGVQDNGKGFTFNETTGAYLSGFNEDGWGTPNPELADATASTLKIYQPDSYTYFYTTSLLTPINLYPAFPTDKSEKTLDIYSVDLGLGDIIMADGIYKFILTTTVSGSIYTSENYYFNLFNLHVERIKLASMLKRGCCNFSDKKVSLYMDLIKGEQLICDYMGCGEYESAAELYQTLAIKMNKIDSLIL